MLAGALAFITTFLAVRWLIRSLRGSTLVGVDIHKANGPRVPEMGGVAVLLGFCAALVYLVGFSLGTISVGQPLYNASILAIFGAAFVGVLDDLFAVPKSLKAILPFLSSLPLAFLLLLRGDTIILGVQMGALILFLVPAGVTSAANVANMLEGFNGLGAGLGIIMAAGLIVLAYLLSAAEGLFLLVPLLGSLLGFIWFNRFPARVFPGDSMTFTMGAVIACAAIISTPSFKLFAFVMFLPMLLEFVLKSRGRFRGENYGRLGADGRLGWDGRIESLTHLIMRCRRLREWQVVAILWAIEGVVALAVILGALVKL